MRNFAALLICLVGLSAHAAEEVRTWTDVDGSAIRAQFIREVDGDVTFLKDGKLLTLPLDRLSEKDQKLIRELETNKKIDDTVAPAGAPRPELIPLTSDDPQAKPGTSNEAARPSLANKRAVAEIRTWRDTKGKQTSGKFVRIHEGNVILTRGARAISMPFASLSRQDQEYVRDFLTSRGEGNLVPELSVGSDDPLPAAIADAPTREDQTVPFVQPQNSPFGPAVPGSGMPGSAVARGKPGPIAERFRDQAQNQSRSQPATAIRRPEPGAQAGQALQQAAAGVQQRIQAREDARKNAPIAECSNCKNDLSKAQTELKKCPHCGVVWVYEVDRWGHKKEIPGGQALAAQEQAAQEQAAPAQPDAPFGFNLTARQQSRLIFRIIIPSIIALITVIGGWMARNNH